MSVTAILFVGVIAAAIAAIINGAPAPLQGDEANGRERGPNIRGRHGL
jgi:hypothetical protein